MIDQSDAVVKRSNAKYGVMVAGLLVLLAAAMVWHVEHLNPDASIHSFADALWWAVATVTTVGYGDVTPRLRQGRIIGAVVMLAGIGFLAVITAAVTATLVESSRRRRSVSSPAAKTAPTRKACSSCSSISSTDRCRACGSA